MKKKSKQNFGTLLKAKSIPQMAGHIYDWHLTHVKVKRAYRKGNEIIFTGQILKPRGRGYRANKEKILKKVIDNV